MKMQKQVPSFLSREDLRLLLFGGKGGVGKTLLACASALYLARVRDDKRVLLVSTDPSHSLGDLFGCSIGNDVTEIEGFHNLLAVELELDDLYGRFEKKYGPVIRKIAEKGTYFDGEDISELFSLTVPGLRYLTVLLEIGRLYRDCEYDLIIIDTASSGHTLRMLSMPKQMEKRIRLFELMQLKHRYLSKVFGRYYVSDEGDEFLDAVTADIRNIKCFLEDAVSTEFVPIVTPDGLSISETERLVRFVKRQRIPVRNMIINRVMKHNGCDFCLIRKDEHHRRVAEINKRFHRYNCIEMPLFVNGTQGIEGLLKVSDILGGKKAIQASETSDDNRRKDKTYERPGNGSCLVRDEPWPKFIILGGKAGSGKTSIACATGVYLAERYPDKKILLFSIDAAHSLSDVFGLRIGDKETAISGLHNLFAVEIDSARIWEERKVKYKRDIRRGFEGFGADTQDLKVQMRFDPEIMVQFIEAAPPHLNEATSIETIMEFVRADKYDHYILDTGPIAQLLLFLSLPEVTLAWTKSVLNILYKYRSFIRLDTLLSRLLMLQRDMRKMAKILRDSRLSELIIATTPDRASIREVERLILKVGQLRIPNKKIVVNMVVPPGGCSRCLNERENQRRYVESLRSNKHSTHKIAEVPLLDRPIVGIDGLSEFSDVLYSERIIALQRREKRWQKKRRTQRVCL